VNGALQMWMMSDLALPPSPPPEHRAYALALISVSVSDPGPGTPRAGAPGISGSHLLSSPPLSHPITQLEKPLTTMTIMAIRS
jgi:hypothetical protein